MPGQVAAIAGPQRLETLPAIAAGRLISSDTLAEQQPFDAIGMECPLAHKHPAFAADAATVWIGAKKGNMPMSP